MTVSQAIICSICIRRMLKVLKHHSLLSYSGGCWVNWSSKVVGTWDRSSPGGGRLGK